MRYVGLLLSVVALLAFVSCGDQDPVSSVSEEGLAAPAGKLTVSANKAGGYRGQDAKPQSQLIETEITSPSLAGNLLGDPATRKLVTYLPPSYNTTPYKRYPTLYLLHGFTGNATTFVSREITGLYWPPEADFPEGGLASLLDELIAAGQMEEMIVVMPDASNVYGGSWYANSVLSGNYEDYIVHDVVSYIVRNYRTLQSRDSRGIMGHSMGGYGAVKLAMKNADVFGAVASHGGPLAWEIIRDAFVAGAIAENPEGMQGPHPEKFNTTIIYSMCVAFSPNLDNPPFFVDLFFDYPTGTIIDEVWEKFQKNDSLSMLETYGANLASLNGIYLDVGDQDAFGTQYQTDAFHQALEAMGIEHAYEMYEGGHFDRIFEHFAISLSFLSDVLAQ